jgi:hypothetical protein
LYQGERRVNRVDEDEENIPVLHTVQGVGDGRLLAEDLDNLRAARRGRKTATEQNGNLTGRAAAVPRWLLIEYDAVVGSTAVDRQFVARG